jgi:hypothetical protein
MASDRLAPVYSSNDQPENSYSVSLYKHWRDASIFAFQKP